MEHRLYYSAPNLEVVEECHRLVQEMQLADGNFSVVSYDSSELEFRRLPAADYFKSLDLFRCSLFGLGYGIASGGLILGSLMLVQPYDMYIPREYYWIPMVVTSCFGLWAGIMTGVAKMNHHLAPFKNKLKRGGSIVMIDITEQRRPLLEQMIKQRIPEARLEKTDYLGETLFDKTG